MAPALVINSPGPCRENCRGSTGYILKRLLSNRSPNANRIMLYPETDTPSAAFILSDGLRSHTNEALRNEGT